MKKSTFMGVFAITIWCLVHTGSFAQNKIGHLNSDELIRSMPETDSINKILSTLEDEYQKLGEDMQVKYNQALEDYNSRQETLKPLEKKLKESELLDLQKRIQLFATESQKDYQKRQQELFQPVLQKAHNAIKEVGRENNLLYILDSANGQLLYVPLDESYNILPLVKSKLGIKVG